MKIISPLGKEHAWSVMVVGLKVWYVINDGEDNFPLDSTSSVTVKGLERWQRRKLWSDYDLIFQCKDFLHLIQHQVSLSMIREITAKKIRERLRSDSKLSRTEGMQGSKSTLIFIQGRQNYDSLKRDVVICPSLAVPLPVAKTSNFVHYHYRIR